MSLRWILTSKEEDRVYIGCEKKVFLVDGDISFDLFGSQIRHISGNGSSPIKIIYFLLCEVMSICAHVIL